MKREPVLFKGDILQCPQCELNIASVTRDCFKGEVLHEAMFKAISYQPRSGEYCLCRECNEPWAIGWGAASIHIKDHGWTS